MLEFIEKLLGLGVIPPEWKQRIYSLLLALIAFVELFTDVPDHFNNEVFIAKVAAAIAVILAFAVKKVRDLTE